MNTRADNPWLDKNCMALVMITKRNSDDGENLYYKGYRLYQDDWEPCAGKIYNQQGKEIAAWNGYMNYYKWLGTEEDKKVLSNLVASAKEGYVLPQQVLVPDIYIPSNKEIVEQSYTSEIGSINDNDSHQRFMGILAFCWIFILAFTILILGGITHG